MTELSSQFFSIFKYACLSIGLIKVRYVFICLRLQIALIVLDEAKKKNKKQEFVFHFNMSNDFIDQSQM